MTSLFASQSSKNRAVTMTLSRAHKVNERINAKLSELRAAITEHGGAVSVQVCGGPDQVALIRDSASKALAQSGTYFQLVQAQASLRAVVGKANTEGGIADLLVKIEKNKKLLTLCDTYLGLAPSANTLSVEALSKRAEGERLAPTEYATISVSGVTAAALAPYATAKAELERENFALQDSLADLNAGKVTFEVAEELLELLSLKPSR